MRKILSLVLALGLMCSMTLVSSAKSFTFEQEDDIIALDTDAILDGADTLQPGVTYRIPMLDGDYQIDEEFMDVWKTTMKVTKVEDSEHNEIRESNIVDICRTEKNSAGDYNLVFKSKNLSKYLGETFTVTVSFYTEERLDRKDKEVTSASERDKYNSDYHDQIVDKYNGVNVEIDDTVTIKYRTDIELEVAFPDEVYLNDDYYEVDNNEPIVTVEGDSSYDRATFAFGGVAEYDARFGSTTKKYHLGYSLTENSGVVKNNPSAKMKFISFTNEPSFVANSPFRVYMSGAKYLYEIDGDALVQLDAKAGDGYMEIRTNRLTSYVVSDRPLSGKVSVPAEKPATPSVTPGTSYPTGGGKPNPDTGR